MKVDADVIRDLLPLYVAGEASPATRALVAEQLAADPELARLATAMADGERPATAATLVAQGLAPEAESAAQTERLALVKTRGLLRRRSWLLGLALAATLVPLSFNFDESGVRFMLQSSPVLASLCLGAGIALWIAFARATRRLRVTGL